MPIRAVLFDFDGTLADSYSAITASVNHVRTVFNMPALTTAQVKPFVGHGLPYLLEHLAPGQDTDRAVTLYRQHHPSVLISGTHLLPGAEETLAALHRRGIKQAVCSNKLSNFTRQLLEAFGLSAFVQVVVGPNDVPRPKPAPDMAQAALKGLGVAAVEAIYVGDMSVDIETARAARLPVWVVPTGSESLDQLQQLKPDRVLSNLADIPALLFQAN